MKNKIYNYYKDQCYFGLKLYKDEELEQIESIEDEDGTIRKRFIIKGMEDGPIFEEPKILKDAAVPPQNNIVAGWMPKNYSWGNTTYTGNCYTITSGATTFGFYYPNYLITR